jgi:hypothetical protein
MKFLHAEKAESLKLLTLQFLALGGTLGDAMLRPGKAIPALLDMLPELMGSALFAGNGSRSSLKPLDFLLKLLLLTMEITDFILEIHDLSLDTLEALLGTLQFGLGGNKGFLHLAPPFMESAIVDPMRPPAAPSATLMHNVSTKSSARLWQRWKSAPDSQYANGAPIAGIKAPSRPPMTMRAILTWHLLQCHL